MPGARDRTGRHALRGTLILPPAIVLTAGLGTRLRPLTDERAKPAMPVAGEPMIRRIIAWLAGHGVTDLVMNLHHRPETLTAVVGDGSDLGARVRYSWEQPLVLGSAGGPRQALSIMCVSDADVLLLVNGDTLTDADVTSLVRAHIASGALVTLALVPNRTFERYGGVQVDGEGRVTGFVKRGPASAGTWHFIGVQAVQASVFARLPAGVPMNSIGGVYEELMRERPGSVRALCTECAFWDVGTAADYLRTSKAFSASGVDVGRRVHIDRSARVANSILWDDVIVGAGASIEDCIIADGVGIPAGASYRRSVIMRRDGDVCVVPLET